MRKYSLTVLIKLDENEEQVVNSIKKVIEKNNATIEDVLFDGMQKLAYPILDEEYCRRYEADCYFDKNEEVANASKELNIMDGVLRYLLCLA